MVVLPPRRKLPPSYRSAGDLASNVRSGTRLEVGEIERKPNAQSCLEEHTVAPEEGRHQQPHHHGLPPGGGFRQPHERAGKGDRGNQHNQAVRHTQAKSLARADDTAKADLSDIHLTREAAVCCSALATPRSSLSDKHPNTCTKQNAACCQSKNPRWATKHRNRAFGWVASQEQRHTGFRFRTWPRSIHARTRCAQNAKTVRRLV